MNNFYHMDDPFQGTDIIPSEMYSGVPKVALMITLDINQEDRAQRALKEIKKMGFENILIIDGVRGSKLTDEQIKKLTTPKAWYDIEHGRYCHEALSGKGSVGCYLSHISAWKKCIELDEPCVIFEDDFETELTKTEFQDIFSKIKECNPGILRLTAKEIDDIHDNYSGNCNEMKKVERGIYSLECYYITPDAAEKILSAALPMEVHVDHYLGFICKKLGIVHLSTPNIAKNQTDSVIGHNEPYNVKRKRKANYTWLFLLVIAIVITTLTVLIL